MLIFIKFALKNYKKPRKIRKKAGNKDLLPTPHSWTKTGDNPGFKDNLLLVKDN
jgi:hypothetical protein